MKHHIHSFEKIVLLCCFMIGLLPFVAESQSDGNSIKKEKFKIRGSMMANMTTGSNNGFAGNQQQLMYSFAGNLNATLYGVQVPVSFSVSRGQFAYTLPFNRVGLSPRYKSLTFHLGYRNMRFSEFTLSGRTFLGGGLEFKPGKFRFSAMYGKIQDARPFTADLLEGFRFIKPTFSRKAMSAKIGYGTENNHVDFIIFRGWDDRNSIEPIPDSLFIKPQENLAVGLNFKVSFLNNFSWTSEVGISGYTSDVNKVELEDTKGLDFIKSVFTPRYSSRASLALNTALFYNSNYVSTGLIYKRIDPYYETMGSFYNLNDVENITLNISLRLFANTTQLSGSFGVENNDLYKLRMSTTQRNIGSANIQYMSREGNAGVFAGYQNYSTNSTNTNPDIFNDSLRILHQMHSFFLSPNYSWGNPAGVRYTVSTNFNYQLIDDQSPLTEMFGDMTMKNMAANVQWSNAKTDWTFNAGFQYHQITSFAGEQLRGGLTGSVSKQLLNRQLNLNLSTSALKNFGGEFQTGFFVSNRLNASYRLKKNHHLNGGIFFLNRPDISGRQVSDFRFNFGYGFNF